MQLFRQFPVLVLLMIAVSVAMLVPAAHAARAEDWAVARTFLYDGLFFATLAVMLGLGAAGRVAYSARNQLLSLVLAYVVLPAIMAVPILQLGPAITPLQAYFEALSGFTTTGASVFDAPSRVNDSLHLWRSMTGWMGGYFILVAALAVLEPMRIGGFEIEESFIAGAPPRSRRSGVAAEGRRRVGRAAGTIAAPYLVATGTLTVLLILAGERNFVALCHAMAILSTSGITPLPGGLEEASAGRIGEAVMAAFLLLAVTRKALMQTVSYNAPTFRFRDPELRIAVFCVLTLPGFLLLRHYVGAVEVSEQDDLAAALQATWGAMFTVLSYLSTFGLTSADWPAAQAWSGLSTPGTLLVGLALMGGGVATTAGGVKLLRVYALFKHGEREMNRLVHPSGVGGAGMTARRIRREGAALAWVFLMLFLLCVAAVLLLLTAVGVRFEAALALAIAMLANTGPAAEALEPSVTYWSLGWAAEIVLCLAMIVGRLEALVVVALFNPAFWRT